MMLLTLSIGTLFLYVPHKGEIGFLLNPEVKLSYNQYFWMLCEHLIMIIFALIIWDESSEYKNLCLLFVWIQIFDTLGFFLAYSDPLRGYVISFNWIKLAFFSLAMGFEIWKHRKQE